MTNLDKEDAMLLIGAVVVIALFGAFFYTIAAELFQISATFKTAV